jgi:CheY-like chemotaxis protein
LAHLAEKIDLSLPRWRCENNARKSGSECRVRAGESMPYTLLIVDDSKLARMAVVKVLSTLHREWPWVEAANAVEALQRIEQDAPDIMLLDFNMPGKDGLAFAAEVREQHAGISVAVISANHQVEVIDRTRAAGATFLPKPLTATALAQFLDAAVQKRTGAA